MGSRVPHKDWAQKGVGTYPPEPAGETRQAGDGCGMKLLSWVIQGKYIGIMQGLYRDYIGVVINIHRFEGTKKVERE